MKSSILLLLLWFMPLFACSDSEEQTEIKTIEDLEQFIISEMESQKIPALSALIFKGNEVKFETYQGKSNIAQNLNLSSNHLFLIASVSKVVTATALLQLYDDGRFGLDDPINSYLPFSVKVPGYTKEITFRMLFTHTSGLADNETVLDTQYFYNQDPTTPLATFIEEYLKVGGTHYNATENFHDFEPGSRFEYGNINTALMAVLVEKIAETDFNTFCKERIFTPLGMNNTSWRLDEISQPIVSPYNYEDGEYEVIQHYTFTDYPNGGLRTTARDLHKWTSAMTNNGQIGSFRLLKPETVAAMMTPQIPSIDATMGLHFFKMSNELGLWGHDGGEQGVTTAMGFNPETKVGVIVFTNRTDAEIDDIFTKAYELGLTL